MAFRQMSTAEKKQYAKQFTYAERQAYRKGKNNGRLETYHELKHRIKPKSDFVGRTYSKQDFNNLFETLGQIKI